MIFLHRYLQKLLILSILVINTHAVTAQITIGANLEPRAGALLDLKESDTDGTQNSKKGLLMPRVALDSSTDLTPLIESATDEEKLLAVGMVVYNVTQNDTVSLQQGMNVWDGEKWVILSGSQCDGYLPAAFTIQSVSVRGTYVKGTELTLLNYLIVVLDVVTVGDYIITGTTTNGYSYAVSGTFTSTGMQTVNVLGSGTPVLSTEEQSDVMDVIQVTINSQTTTVNNTVLTHSVDYLIDCNSLTVNGTYIVGTAIDPSTNYISVQGMATTSSADAMFEIGTETVNGYSFSKQDLLTGGSQTFVVPPPSSTLTPLTQGQDDFILTTNSNLTATTCPFSVWVVYPAMSLSVTNNSYANYPSTMTTKATSLTNYGPSGIYNKVEKITATTAALATMVTNMQGTSPPDFSIVNYGATLTSAQATTALQYIQSGKILMYSLDYSTTYVPYILSVAASLLGVTTSDLYYSNTNSDTESATIALASSIASPDNSIINGPFGDASGLTFLYDGGANWEIGLQSTVTDESIRSRFITIASLADGYGRIVVIKDSNSKGALILVTDGGAWSYMATSGYESKNILFGNILAWAVDRLNE